MSKIITVSETAAWFKERDRFLIITHRRPDGDTVGCAGALAQGLSEQGKTVFILENPEITPRYLRFMEDHIAPDGYEPEHIIVVDTASYDLFPNNAEKYKNSISLCIDHHPSNTGYADLLCLESDRAACGEIIFEILMTMTGSIGASSAGRLYAAISTDTGCFTYGNTTANSLFVASLLVEAGAPLKELNKLLFRTKTRSRIMMEGMITSNLEFFFDGKAAITIITREMMEKANADEDDIDDISSLPGGIEGVYIGITIRELTSPLDSKISVRTAAPYNASTICKHFGGGGHSLAAGATVAKTVGEVKAEMLEVLGGMGI